MKCRHCRIEIRRSSSGGWMHVGPYYLYRDCRKGRRSLGTMAEPKEDK